MGNLSLQLSRKYVFSVGTEMGMYPEAAIQECAEA